MSEGIELGTKHQRRRVGLLDDELYHLLPDHELDRLAEGSTPAKEIALTAGGAAFGLALPAFEAWELAEAGLAIGRAELIAAALFLLAIGMALASGMVLLDRALD